MGRRYGDLTNFFVRASVLHLQQRLVRLAHNVREKFPLDREQQTKELRARICDVIDLTPFHYTGDSANLYAWGDAAEVIEPAALPEMVQPYRQSDFRTLP